MPDINLDVNIGLTFKGFFQIYDGATPFRFRELIEVIIAVAADTEKHYSDDGIKRKKSVGDSSTFQFRVKKTADLYDTTSPAVDIKTVSFFQEQIINDRVIPIGEFEGVQETEAPSNAFIRTRFKSFVENIEDTRNPATGAPEVVISGEIQTIVKSQRVAS